MTFRTLLLFAIAGLVAFVACKKDVDPDNTATYDGTPYQLTFGNFPPPPISPDNKLTEQGVKLGRMLFYEKKLSGDGTQACASCHRQEHAFTDTAQFSTGILGFLGGRQAMSAFNMAWNTNQYFWDGRANLLRDQSIMPIQDSLEMHETLPNVVAKLSADKIYTDQFSRAFGTSEVTSERISLALEQFMNSIVSVNSKFDKAQAGSATLTPSEERGRRLYFSEFNPFFPDSSGADCAHCHGGPNFSNNEYMNNGLDAVANQTDIGRQKATGNPGDRAKFKVVSLRNIALTAPYMHDGRFNTLEEVIEHYDSGIETSPTLEGHFYQILPTGLMLSAQDKADLKAFLLTLTDDDLMSNPAYASPF
jgi:cytochrome c peroxidase